MLASIYFYGYFSPMTIKVNDIGTDYFLSLKSNGIFFQKAIPQVSFLFCHILTQLSRA